jgi:hypothetical protein
MRSRLPCSDEAVNGEGKSKGSGTRRARMSRKVAPSSCTENG